MYMTFEECGLIVGTPEWEKRQLNKENDPVRRQAEQGQNNTSMLFSRSF